MDWEKMKKSFPNSAATPGPKAKTIMQCHPAMGAPCVRSCFVLTRCLISMASVLHPWPAMGAAGCVVMSSAN